MAIKHLDFHFSLYFSKRWRDYIFIGEEGNRRGHLGIPKVPYIKTLLGNSKDFTENKETLKYTLRDALESKRHDFWG